MAAYITVGAKTSHGGTVISGSPHTTHNGIPVARKGDKVICKKCKKVTTIVSGDASFIVDGAPIARGGDVTSCGAKLIATQQAFAESDFDVGSIAQAEPLVFPKSEPDALFGNSFASTKGLKNSNEPKKPTGYNADGTKQTQKQINDAWIAYYDHKNKAKAEALTKQKKEDRSIVDKTLDFFGFGDDSQADNAINTTRQGNSNTELTEDYKNPMAKVRDEWKGEAADGIKKTGIVFDNAGRQVSPQYDAGRAVLDNVINKNNDALKDKAIDKATGTGKSKLVEKAKDIAPKRVRQAWDTYDDYNAVKEKGSDIQNAISKDD